jgi:hypothetical protein
VPAGAPRRIAYTAADGSSPSVVIGDVGSDEPLVVDEGAYSIAWRSDGAIAYVKALQPDVTDPREYEGHVVVRPAPAGAAARWSDEPGRYVVAAWARERLLVYRLREGWPDLFVLDGPRRARALGRTGLIAVSPDGERVAVTDFGAAPPRVRVLELASGREAAAADIGEVGWILHAGAWEGDVVVAAAEGAIVVLRVGQAAIELLEALRFEDAELPASVAEPQLEGRRVTAWGEVEARARQPLPGSALVECELGGGGCRALRHLPAGAEPRPVFNPSRPLDEARSGPSGG